MEAGVLVEEASEQKRVLRPIYTFHTHAHIQNQYKAKGHTSQISLCVALATRGQNGFVLPSPHNAKNALRGLGHTSQKRPRVA